MSIHNVSLEEITPLLRKNLKSTPEEILEAVQGNLTHEQNSKMKICLDHYDTLIECIDNIEKAVFFWALDLKFFCVNCS